MDEPRPGIKPISKPLYLPLSLGGPGTRPCAKCEQEPAAKGQRWGRVCRAAYNKQRRQETVRVPREFVKRGTLDVNGRVRVAALKKAKQRLRKMPTAQRPTPNVELQTGAV